MKRILCFAIASIIISTMLFSVAGAQDIERIESSEYLYNDVIIGALIPAMDKAVSNYYKTKYKETPGFQPDFAVIKKIERPNGDRTSYFIIEVEVQPYFGPHITVGKDRITLEIKGGELPKVIKFKHLEDYPLPERYQDFYL